MKSVALTQKGTVPVDFKPGRQKPYRLRVTIAGKRHEQYFPSRADALAEWRKLAAVTGTQDQPIATGTIPPGLTVREVAEYLHWRARLAYAGMTVAEAMRSTLDAKPEAPDIEIRDRNAPSWIEAEDIIPLLQQISSELAKLTHWFNEPPARLIPNRVIRSTSGAARYCGFSNTEAFVKWADRVGFNIPKTKLAKNQRGAFLVSELNAALLRDPSIYANRRERV